MSGFLGYFQILMEQTTGPGLTLEGGGGGVRRFVIL